MESNNTDRSNDMTKAQMKDRIEILETKAVAADTAGSKKTFWRFYRELQTLEAKLQRM